MTISGTSHIAEAYVTERKLHLRLASCCQPVNFTEISINYLKLSTDGTPVVFLSPVKNTKFAANFYTYHW